MARFCTSCGSTVADDLSFCSQCGTPLAPSAAAAGAPPQAGAVGTVPIANAGAPVPAAAPVKSGGGPLLKIILAIVLVIVFIMVASIGACVYVGYRARQRMRQFSQGMNHTYSRTEGTPDIHMEKGGPGSGAAQAIAAEVPIYPDATPTQGGGQLSFGGMGGISVQEFETTDGVDKVVAFYKEKLGTDIPQQSEGHYQVMVNKIGDQRVGMVTIEIQEEKDAGKTKITISRLGGNNSR